ncbi:terpenoid synthase [Daedalea quercina L-15889]|uniref:Terpenoid synthase n=1 Tax=Daedalea quercina L-15889 TaxID=1314783 RepID=A0A165TGD0_9APHY|nr:terpenoid synthase [Daedalea quercina L-15889]
MSSLPCDTSWPCGDFVKFLSGLSHLLLMSNTTVSVTSTGAGDEIASQYQTKSMTTADIISEFLQSLRISQPTYVRDPELRSRVEEIINKWDFAEHMRPQILIGLALAETSYNHISNVDTRAAIALYCALIAYLDNIDLFDSLSARKFPRQLCAPSSEDSTWVGALRGILLSMWDWYPDFGANTIFHSALGYFSGAMLECAPGRSRAIHARTLPFVELRRNLSGIPDPFTCFVWEKSMIPDEKTYVEVLPDARIYINYLKCYFLLEFACPHFIDSCLVNSDIVSCYKEELEDDTDNYIYTRAAVTGKSVSETLHDVIGEWFAARERIRWLLPQGPAREAWDSFETGFVSLHLVLPRYRLQELLGGEYLATY